MGYRRSERMGVCAHHSYVHSAVADQLGRFEPDPVGKNILKRHSFFPCAPFAIFLQTGQDYCQNCRRPRRQEEKKSYKEIRPRGTRAPITDYSDPVRPGVLSASAKPAAPTKPAAKKEEPAASPTFDHSLFKFDEDTDDDFDFDFDSFDKKFSDTKPDETPKEEPKEAPKPAPAKSKNNKDKKNNAQRNDAPSPAQARPAGNSTLDVLKQKGYEVITAATVKKQRYRLYRRFRQTDKPLPARQGTRRLAGRRRTFQRRRTAVVLGKQPSHFAGAQS